MSSTADQQTPPEPTLPTDQPLCQEGAEPDRFALFATLRAMWRDEADDRTYKQLAQELGVPKQTVAQWATGSGGKQPAPWWIIMRLCARFDLCLVLAPGGASLHRSTNG